MQQLFRLAMLSALLSLPGQSVAFGQQITPAVGQPLPVRDSVMYIRSALIKTNILGPFSLFLEVPTGPKQSVQLSAQAFIFNFFSNTRFFSLTLDYRFYLNTLLPSARRPAPKGFYVSPYLKYRTETVERTSLFYGNTLSTTVYTTFGGGVVAGAQLVRRKGFTIDAFLGGGYYPFVTTSVTTTNSYSPPEARPQDYRFDIRPGFCLGVAF